jgi:hypothetical protein
MEYRAPDARRLREKNVAGIRAAEPLEQGESIYLLPYPLAFKNRYMRAHTAILEPFWLIRAGVVTRKATEQGQKDRGSRDKECLLRVEREQGGEEEVR